MNHSAAKQIFEEIRNRPFGTSTQPGMPSNNCYFKGIELLQRLGILGYAVRGVVGETYWDTTKIPAAIIKLYSPEFLVTHFVVEVLLDDEWQILDPSYDPPLAKHGLVVNEWGKPNTPCFAITKFYTQVENIAYQAEWHDETYAAKYFTDNAEFFKQLNAWYESLRQ